MDDPWSQPAEPYECDGSSVWSSADEPLETPLDEAPPPAPPPRFCTACGEPWNPSWTACPVCQARQERALKAASEVPATTAPLRSALSLYFVLLGANLIGVIAALVSKSAEVEIELVLTVVFGVITLAYVAAKPSRVLGGLTTFGRPVHYLAAAGLGCLTFLLAAGLIKSLSALIGLEEITYSKTFLTSGYGWGTVFLIVAIAPPVMEELAFRGVVLGSLQEVLERRDAVLVSAALFMILHLMPLSFPHLFVMGLLLAYLRLWSGSLYPCMLLHGVHNSLVLLTEFARF